MVGVQCIGWIEPTTKLYGPRLGELCTSEVRAGSGPGGEPVALQRECAPESGMGGRR